MRFMLGLVTGLAATSLAQDYKVMAPTPPTEFTFMILHAVNQGRTENEKFFLGPLPAVGQAVEMVYVGDDGVGGMRMQLRAKP